MLESLNVGIYELALTCTALRLAERMSRGARAVEDMDWDKLTIKGTCQAIEKSYFRLTSAPDPSTVRPLEVLRRALDAVKASDRNYFYTCDQMKAIRWG